VDKKNTYMLLFPKNVKFKKTHSRLPQKIEMETCLRSLGLQYGSFGLKTLESGHISARQIEACRRIIIRVLRRFPDSQL